MPPGSRENWFQFCPLFSTLSSLLEGKVGKQEWDREASVPVGWGHLCGPGSQEAWSETQLHYSQQCDYRRDSKLYRTPFPYINLENAQNHSPWDVRDTHYILTVLCYFTTSISTSTSYGWRRDRDRNGQRQKLTQTPEAFLIHCQRNIKDSPVLAHTKKSADATINPQANDSRNANILGNGK